MEQNQMTDEKILVEERGLVWLPVSELYPHPDNPRKEVGDVSELAESIKAKGVMQNLTVVRGRYENGSREPIEGIDLDEPFKCCRGESRKEG